MTTAIKGPRSAFVPHDLQRPLSGSAVGVLTGLRVAVKDMFDIAGERVSGGSPDWLASQAPAERHAAVVQRVLDHGGTIIGKTICDEFFYSATGANAHYGTPINARAPLRLPGGSSSGSASACASGCCDIAIGSDTAGSVRIPAALNGVYGIRVSRHRMDLAGAMSMAPSFDAGGWFAASPGLFRVAGGALLSAAPANSEQPRITRAVLLDDAFDNTDPRIAALLRRLLGGISGWSSLEQAHIAGDRIEAWREAMRIVQAFEVWRSFGNFLSGRQHRLGPGIAERMKFAASVTPDMHRQSRIVLDEATSRAEDLAAPGTVLVLPTVPCIAPLLTASPSELERYRLDVMRLACIASISGLPQITVPAGTLDGAPIGLSFIGPRGSDEALLDLAVELAPALGISG